MRELANGVSVGLYSRRPYICSLQENICRLLRKKKIYDVIVQKSELVDRPEQPTKG